MWVRVGRLVNGHYEKGDFGMAGAVPSPTSVWRGSDHDRQRADHVRDMLKPHLPNGDWNPAFIEQYPGEAEASWGWKPPESEDLRSKL